MGVKWLAGGVRPVEITDGEATLRVTPQRDGQALIHASDRADLVSLGLGIDERHALIQALGGHVDAAEVQ